MYCKHCEIKDVCNKVCPEVERYLERKDKDRLYSDRHIRRKEIPFSNDYIDERLSNIK